MTTHARGTFDVYLKPLPLEGDPPDATRARMSIDKRYHGDLEATGRGQMLTAGTPEKGSAGYVAIERVSGTLGGRRGSFALQHSGVMTRGQGEVNISVVPDSGTDQLEGLTGKLAIIIANGVHSYDFEYDIG
jgi:hypothetical protein